MKASKNSMMRFNMNIGIFEKNIAVHKKHLDTLPVRLNLWSREISTEKEIHHETK